MGQRLTRGERSACALPSEPQYAFDTSAQMVPSQYAPDHSAQMALPQYVSDFSAPIVSQQYASDYSAQMAPPQCMLDYSEKLVPPHAPDYSSHIFAPPYVSSASLHPRNRMSTGLGFPRNIAENRGLWTPHLSEDGGPSVSALRRHDPGTWTFGSSRPSRCAPRRTS